MITIGEQTTFLLETELVGENKQYPTIESLYTKDYENNTLNYLPEVFERYVEIYNEILKNNEQLGIDNQF